MHKLSFVIDIHAEIGEERHRFLGDWKRYQLAFAQLIELEVQAAMEQGIMVPKDVKDSSKPPSLQARRFKSMYFYGYHYRVKSAEESITKTCDSGVVAVFRRPC